MDFALTPEQTLIRQTAAAIAQRELAPQAAALDIQGGFPREAIATSSELRQNCPQIVDVANQFANMTVSNMATTADGSAAMFHSRPSSAVCRTSFWSPTRATG